MEVTKTKLNILTGVIATVLVVSIAGNIYYWNKSRDLASEKDRVEQKANALLRGQSRDLYELRKQLGKVNEEKESLVLKAKELNSLITQVNNDIWELRTSKATTKEDLELIHSRSESSIWDLNKRAEALSDINRSLGSQNNLLSQRVDALNDSLQAVTNTLTVDGFRMIALKSNNKETAKAKKVDVLTVSFKVPSGLGIRGREEVYLNLSDAQGRAIKPQLRTISLLSSTEEIPVHAAKSIDFTQQTESVTLTVYDTENIKPGMYRASIYTKDKYLGSVEVQFRDSFWFF
jgi:prefoldin subunit 5